MFDEWLKLGSISKGKNLFSSDNIFNTSMIAGSLIYTGVQARKARKQQERQFKAMMDQMNKPGPKPLQQTGGGAIDPVTRGAKSKRRKKPAGPSKANQGLLSMDTEPSLLR